MARVGVGRGAEVFGGVVGGCVVAWTGAAVWDAAGVAVGGVIDGWEDGAGMAGAGLLLAADGLLVGFCCAGALALTELPLGAGPP